MRVNHNKITKPKIKTRNKKPQHAGHAKMARLSHCANQLLQRYLITGGQLACDVLIETGHEGQQGPYSQPPTRLLPVDKANPARPGAPVGRRDV
jgi:hypothetical protein